MCHTPSADQITLGHDVFDGDLAVWEGRSLGGHQLLEPLAIDSLWPAERRV
jgi:hypothetical protein